MRKFFISVLTVLTVLVLTVSGGCATAGYTGLTGLSVPGYEVAGVVAANQAMIAGLANQAIQPLYATVPGYGNVPICRLQDLQGLPPIYVNQPVIVRVDKSKGHRTADIIGGAAIGAGLGYLNGGSARAVVVGAGVGAGGGLLVANHEPADLCLLLPVKTP